MSSLTVRTSIKCIAYKPLGYLLCKDLNLISPLDAKIHTLPDFCDLISILLHWKMHFNLLQFQSVEMHYVNEEMLGLFRLDSK